MNIQIQKLDNDTLLRKTKDLAKEERRITLEILHHLREINRRRLFAFRGYSSLFDYATRELGYSDASAARRIAAMRLIAELPEVETKIKEGSLSLSNAAQAQRLFQNEVKSETPKTLEEKKEIIKSIENKSTRDAEKELISRSSQPITALKPDKIKPVTPSKSEVRFVADQVLLDQLELIKGLLAHKHPNLTLAELIGEMAKYCLDKLQPKAPKAVAASKPQTPSEDLPVSKQPQAPARNPQASNRLAPPTVALAKKDDQRRETSDVPNSGATPAPAPDQRRHPKGGGQSRYIPVEVKRAIYQRDGGKCSFVDPETGRKCDSTYVHIWPILGLRETSVRRSV